MFTTIYTMVVNAIILDINVWYMDYNLIIAGNLLRTDRV